jgi:hypothetical protein
MKSISFAVLAAALCAACAQAGSGATPTARAEQQCGYFAREEGLRLLEVAGVDSDGDNVRVRMRLEDGLNRKLSATCVFATKSNKASWAQALPAGYLRI